ncbi:hypothetical protein SELMODRAFT_129542 [Selaginella moellendorffii]|uniref:Peroxisomal membrane protein MPV17 n=1 Tax=Selaginella moellendorffii TaxID=88036 RepID=D8T0Y3_SELML|nr:protein SYM1 [Selaginella moellendorffii]EFJ09671.1 hypothetical protein SELMODRAFT_129542 [Selaginella moellendorffii]|eukprot:XP_002989233.1 protein SYM1 [Selaginella moellendorffii]
MGTLGWDGAWFYKQRLGFDRKSSKGRAGKNSSGSTSSSSGRFPFKQAMVAGSLALTGDTIAQLRGRWNQHKNSDAWERELWNHDWVRALRMASYGFLLYGPGSQAWYELLDWYFPAKTMRNLSIKIVLNQLVLGPCVILVIFAWNSIWQGQARELPSMYKNKALPTLVDGWKFWIPASALNFSVVPLDARVGFMSCCSIFWNFYLSNAMGKR